MPLDRHAIADPLGLAGPAIRAVQLPELVAKRRKLLNDWTSPRLDHLAPNRGVNNAIHNNRFQCQVLEDRTTGLYYGTRDFCSLLEDAARDFTIDEVSGILPSEPRGIIYLETPMTIEPMSNAEWDTHSMPITGNVHARMLMWGAHMALREEDYAPTMGLWHYAIGVDDDGDDAYTVLPEELTKALTTKGRKLPQLTQHLLASWALLKQPGMLEVDKTKVEPSRRKSGRRERRANSPVPRMVQVINLRKTVAQQHSVVQDARRAYAHRWVVKGHWRNQACGPKLTERRRIYVAPYVKGPDGSPLLTPRKVYQW